MATHTTRNAVSYNCDGVQTRFQTGFRVLAAGDIEVVCANEAGVETTLVLNTDYTVELDPNNENAYVVCAEPPPNGRVLSISRLTGISQGHAFGPLDERQNDVVEAALDRLTLAAQDSARIFRAAGSKQTVVLEDCAILYGTQFPAQPTVGQIFYNTQTKTYYVYGDISGTPSWAKMFSLATSDGTYCTDVIARSGGILSSHLDMRGHQIKGAATSQDGDLITKGGATSGLPYTGGTMSGNIDMDSTYTLRNVAAATNAGDLIRADARDSRLATHTHDGTDSAALALVEDPFDIAYMNTGFFLARGDAIVPHDVFENNNKTSFEITAGAAYLAHSITRKTLNDNSYIVLVYYALLAGAASVQLSIEALPVVPWYTFHYWIHEDSHAKAPNLFVLPIPPYPGATSRRIRVYLTASATVTVKSSLMFLTEVQA